MAKQAAESSGDSAGLGKRRNGPDGVAEGQENNPNSGPAEEQGATGKTRNLARALWATILGLAFARCSGIMGSYNSYRQTDFGVFTDGAVLVGMGVCLLLMLVIACTKARLHKRQVNAIMRTAMFAQVVLLVFMCVLSVLDASHDASEYVSLHFALHVCNSILAWTMTFYWLRYMRESNAFTAIGVIALAVIISEVVLLVSAFLPQEALSYAFGAALVALELPMMRRSRKVPRPYEVDIVHGSGLLFDFAKDTREADRDDRQRRRALVNMGVGIGLMSMVIGLLRGYPSGASIPFTPAARIVYFVIIVALLWLAIVGARKGRVQMMTRDIWLVMEGLACLSLLLFAFFPDALQIGAVPTTVLNAVMVAFTRYAVVIFLSYGWRDPYYYCIGGFAVFLVPRAVTRMCELALFVQWGVNAEQVSAIIVCLLMLSTQVVFNQASRFSDAAAEKQQAEQNDRFEKEKSRLIERIMGLDNEKASDAPESLEDMRLRAVKANAARIGETFLLSDREVEVLALYAMGHTQKRVADELYISPGTVHAHIKRIYAKTGLHSRQEILDYMQQYGE